MKTRISLQFTLKLSLGKYTPTFIVKIIALQFSGAFKLLYFPTKMSVLIKRVSAGKL